MVLSIVSTTDRPDLAPVTARWGWEAFFRDSGRSFDDILAAARRTAKGASPMPRTLVLLADQQPVGTASLAEHDLDERPDLTPWLAGVYVTPQARGRGYATRLIAAVEEEASTIGTATLWLYTNSAEHLYARAGWRTAEVIQHDGKPFVLMRRDLRGGSGSGTVG